MSKPLVRSLSKPSLPISLPMSQRTCWYFFMCFAHPDDVRTIEANEKIGELCGARADLARVGEHAATTCTWLSPTVGDLENVTPAGVTFSMWSPTVGESQVHVVAACSPTRARSARAPQSSQIFSLASIVRMSSGARPWPGVQRPFERTGSRLSSDDCGQLLRV